jgi:tight adherence protein B
MPDMTMLVIGGGVLGVLLVLIALFSGPSTGKASNRRLEGVRERHSRSSEIAAQVQLKKIMANRRRTTKVDGLASSLIPNPTLLRQRLAMTGKSWTLTQYVGSSLALLVVVFVLLYFRGAPLALALALGLLVGLAVPHMAVNRFIKKPASRTRSS